MGSRGCIAATGVGSLPHVDPAEAVAVVARHAPVVPWWPQLPGRDPAEGMLRQGLGLPVAGGSGRVGPAAVIADGPAGLEAAGAASLIEALDAADPALDPGEAAGFPALLAAIAAGRFAEVAAVKGQVTGPITLARWLVLPTGRALDDPDVAAALVRRVIARARWQVAALAATGLPVVLVVDEPGLDRSTEAHVGCVSAVLDAIVEAGALTAVHSCADQPVALPPVSPLRLVEVSALDADPPWMVDDPRMRGGSAIHGPQEVVLVTPSCGLAGRTTEEAEAALARAGRVAEALGSRSAGQDLAP